MPIFLIAIVFAPLAVFLGRLLIRWLAQRPEKEPVYSPEEIQAELDRAFTKRQAVTFIASSEYLPIVFEKLHLGIDGGFAERQVGTLIERIDNHRAFEARHAVYPIDFRNQASDLEFQWVRDGEGRVKMAVIAVPGVLDVARAALQKIPANPAL